MATRTHNPWLRGLPVALCCSLLWVAAPVTGQTPDDCQSLRGQGKRAEARDCYGRLIRSSDPYLRAEGHWGLRQYQEANQAFREAVARQPDNPLYRVRWGRMYAEHYQPADAAQLFQEALEIRKDYAPALLGLAIVAAGSFESRAGELAEQALKLDPQLTEARELLAFLALEDGDEEKAAAEARRVLAQDPDAAGALSILAVIDLLNDRPAPPSLKQILARNPSYGEVWQMAGHFFVLNRRYEEGIAAYREALKLDPELWKARSELGVNLMRLGRHEEARRELESCFYANYRSPSTVNSLRLLDSYANFETIRTQHGVLRLHKREAAILRPYFARELDRSVETFTKKYQMKLPGPVVVEAYPDHEDFAVRTLGMPGLGALGVTFGMVVAMDSPSARKPGSFHWASTLWHEMSHVFVLEATRHRVPRWFTEGLAVHEETQVSPEWGDRVSPVVLAAFREKALLPVAELDRGFVRPKNAAQIAVSYFQAGKICDYINQRWGWDTLLAMMRGFAQLKSTPEVIQENLGLTPAQFDAQFLTWLEKQLGPLAEKFDQWRTEHKQLVALHHARNFEAVLEKGPALRDLYPEYVEEASVYEMLADAQAARGSTEAAAEELWRYVRAGGRDPELIKRLARWERERGRLQAAVSALERINFVAPTRDEELHRTLGELYLEVGRTKDAVQEFQVALESNPVDRAAAHYRLARAYYADQQTGMAEEQVFLALEAAPGYREAQRLLLELKRAKP